MTPAEMFKLEQLKKDNRFVKVDAIKLDVDGGEFKQRFRDYDEVSELSIKMYMADNFKGLLPPSDGVNLEKTEVERRAEQLLQIPIEEIEAAKAQERQRELEK